MSQYILTHKILFIFHGITENIHFYTAVRLKLEQIQLVIDSRRVGTGVIDRKGLLQGHFLEQGDRQNLQQSVERGIQLQLFLDDGDEHIETNTAIQICVLTVFSGVPKRRLIRRGCLIHLKNSSTGQGQRPVLGQGAAPVRTQPCVLSLPAPGATEGPFV